MQHFQNLKEAIASEPILKLPDYEYHLKCTLMHPIKLLWVCQSRKVIQWPLKVENRMMLSIDILLTKKKWWNKCTVCRLGGYICRVLTLQYRSIMWPIHFSRYKRSSVQSRRTSKDSWKNMTSYGSINQESTTKLCIEQERGISCVYSISTHETNFFGRIRLCAVNDLLCKMGTSNSRWDNQKVLYRG